MDDETSDEDQGDQPVGDQPVEEQPPAFPSDDELQQVWAEADMQQGGSGDVAAIQADTTNACQQFCFYYYRSDGQEAYWGAATFCAPSIDAVISLVELIVALLRARGYPVSRAVPC